MKTAKNELTFIYNSGNVQERKAMAYALSLKDRQVKTIDVQENPLTATQLKDIANSLDVEADQLVDKRSTSYLRYLTNTDLSEGETLKVLKQSQAMLKTPIILTSEKGYFVDNLNKLVKLDLEFTSST